MTHELTCEGDLLEIYWCGLTIRSLQDIVENGIVWSPDTPLVDVAQVFEFDILRMDEQRVNLDMLGGGVQGAKIGEIRWPRRNGRSVQIIL